ncbi:MAG: M48 family metallopeptidase [Melioribacteraceae bacterium]
MSIKNAASFIDSNQERVLKFLTKIKKIEKDKTPVSDELLKLMRKEAKEYLPKRLRELAEKNNLQVNEIRLKNHKTKWGSCSSKNNINLNINLIRLPNRLIDYIIMHELAHTIHHNHSADFWKYLENIFPGAKLLDREMKGYRVGIY